MHYYNGLSAAKRIQISYKTLLRYIEKGRIIPEEGKTPTGQLVISEDQVEALRLEIQRERGMFRHTQSDMPRYRQTETAIDSPEVPLTDTTLTETIKQLGKLQARVDVQDARIAELERRVAELEGRTVPARPIPPLPTSDIIPQPKPTKSDVDASSTIPADWTLCSDFFESHGFKETSFRRWLMNGIAGEYFEFEEKPVAGTSKKYRYFTSPQQEAAIELLKKHGKLS